MENLKDVFTQIEVSENAMVLDANWWSGTYGDQNRRAINCVEDWANRTVIEDGHITLNGIREKFDLPPVPEDIEIPFKPERGNLQLWFDVFVIDERDAGNGEKYIVDIVF